MLSDQTFVAIASKRAKLCFWIDFFGNYMRM